MPHQQLDKHAKGHLFNVDVQINIISGPRLIHWKLILRVLTGVLEPVVILEK